MFKVPYKSFKAHISTSCSLQRLRNIGYYGQKQLLHLFHVCVCSNGLLNYSFQCVPFLFVLTLGDVLLGAKHEGSLDADDLMVLQLSFLTFLHFAGKV